MANQIPRSTLCSVATESILVPLLIVRTQFCGWIWFPSKVKVSTLSRMIIWLLRLTQRFYKWVIQLLSLVS